MFGFLNRGNQQQPQQQQQSNQQRADAATNTPIQADPNGNPVAGQQQQQQQQQQPAKPLSGLDLLTHLTHNSQNRQQQAAPALMLDQTKLASVAKSYDFTKSIPQEVLANLDPNMTAALMPLLNAVGQAAYQQSLQDAAAVTGGYLDTRMQYEQQQLGQQLRTGMVSSNLTKVSNMHPMAQNMFRSLAEQLAVAYPDATTSEIESRALEALAELGSQFVPATVNPEPPKPATTQSWDEFGGFANPSDQSS